MIEMTVWCGVCGKIIFVSNNKDWIATNHPQMTCPNCAEKKRHEYYRDRPDARCPTCHQIL